MPPVPPIFRFALLLLVAVSGLAATTQVTTTADAGPGSFRQALLDAASGACAAPCTIEFAIPGPGSDFQPWHGIELRTPLPNLTVPGTSIDASTQPPPPGNSGSFPVRLIGSALAERSGLRLVGCDGCSVRNLWISLFPGHGVLVQDSSEVRLDELSLVANELAGVAVVASSATTVRGSQLSANGSNGAYITGSTGTVILGNAIGTWLTSDSDLHNAASGVHIHASDGTLVETNTIAFNGHHGINVTGAAERNTFTANRIHSNGLLGIDLGGDARDPIDPGDGDAGPNGRTNAPVIESVQGDCSEAVISGRIDSLPSTTYLIEVFAVLEPDVWGGGEGDLYLGAAATTTDAAGIGSWSLAVGDGMKGSAVVATATRADGATSEFSLPAAIPGIPCADLLIDVHGKRGTIPAGDETPFEVSVFNTGPTGSAPRELLFRIDAGTVAGSNPACSSISPQEVRCLVPSLAAEGSDSNFIISIDVRTPAETRTITATATLLEADASPDPVRSNDTASASIEVSALPNLIHFLRLPELAVDPGTRVEIPVGIRNEGSGDAGGVVLTIDTSPALTVEPVGVPGWDCDPTATGIRCTHPAITAKVRGTILFAIVTPSSGRVPEIHIRTSLTTTSGDFDPDDTEQDHRIGIYRTRSVTTLADSGEGSLRQAMIDVQEPDCQFRTPCKVMFRVPAELAVNGVFTIRPSSPLPPIRQSHVLIDGVSQAVFAGETNPFGPEIEIDGSGASPGSAFLIEGEGTGQVELRVLIINGWDGHGVEVATRGNRPEHNHHTFLEGLFIGTDASGIFAAPNRGHGVLVREGVGSTHVVAGFHCTGEWRPDCQPALIGGNEGDGIHAESDHLRVGAVRIGPSVYGLPIPNGGNGITLDGTEASIEGTWIEHNRGDGIRVLDGTGAAALHRMSFRHNEGLGIDLGADGVTANDLPDLDGILNSPEILSASFDPATGRTTVTVIVPGLLPAEPNQFFEPAVFASDARDPSGFGEGWEQLDIRRLHRIDGQTWELEVERDCRGKWLTGVLFEFIQWYPIYPRTDLRMSELGKAFFMEP